MWVLFCFEVHGSSIPLLPIFIWCTTEWNRHSDSTWTHTCKIWHHWLVHHHMDTRIYGMTSLISAPSYLSYCKELHLAVHEVAVSVCEANLVTNMWNQRWFWWVWTFYDLFYAVCFDPGGNNIFLKEKESIFLTWTWEGKPPVVKCNHLLYL